MDDEQPSPKSKNRNKFIRYLPFLPTTKLSSVIIMIIIIKNERCQSPTCYQSSKGD
ncbi:hypothetical protein MC7420_7498 [Coleofasciculus chthonoplastes PCC 7420]|uniref:Uncharacterized protein n=1 Tax=Coleofasciculus chthonoplastes PCC 7420 TaxID=118168 RepID=B4W128_9CYAN|nr:hypothetical protein MC7420_7498 [Coleofasciculus chthonoplastes PCC 7420]